MWLMPHPWRFSRWGWIRPWATWSGCGVPVHCRGAGLDDLWRFLLTLRIPWLYDSTTQHLGSSQKQKSGIVWTSFLWWTFYEALFLLYVITMLVVLVCKQIKTTLNLSLRWSCIVWFCFIRKSNFSEKWEDRSV